MKDNLTEILAPALLESYNYIASKTTNLARKVTYRDYADKYKRWTPETEQDLIDALMELCALLQDFYHNQKRDSDLGKCWVQPTDRKK